MKKEELLKILDMSEEDEQEEALWEIYSPDHYCCLAELAFRLRDEVAGTIWWDGAKIDVWEYVCSKKNRDIQLELFWIDWSQPIHWIIAALIAKENM